MKRVVNIAENIVIMKGYISESKDRTEILQNLLSGNITIGSILFSISFFLNHILKFETSVKFLLIITN